MTDLEQRLRAEFDRQAAAAPTAAATERFALALLDSRRHRRVRWLIPAVAALVLIVPILTVLLVHRHKTAQPGNPQDIVGIEWLLTREVDPDGTSHAPPTGSEQQLLRFDGKGAITFNWDCNDAAGSVTIGPGTLETKGVMVTAVGCRPGGDNAMGLFVSDGQTLSWQVVDHELTISGRDGHQLVFVARPSNPPGLVGVRWVLTESVDADGARHDQDGSHTLFFDGNGDLAFDLDCNNDASGSVQLGSDAMTISHVASTLVGCSYVGPAADAPPPDPMKLLIPVAGAQTLRWHIVAGALTITAQDGRALVFAVPQTDPKDLVGVDWRLSQEISSAGSVRTAPTGSQPQSLQLDGKGGISFSWACNGASGKASVTAGRLKTTQLIASTVGCVAQWGDGMQLLSSTATLSWQIVDHKLTITGPDGRKLLFREQPA